MAKIIYKQNNEDGTRTIVYKDSKNHSEVVVVTGKTPHVIDNQLVSKDKLKETLSEIRKEVSERMLIFTLLCK